MTLKIVLDADAESRLKSAASRRGVKPEDYAKQLIEQNLPANQDTLIDNATLALLARWDAEDATTDTDEIDARRREVQDFQKAINENRRQSEGPTSRKIYP